ncbi:DsbA family oxidoreductase [Paraburkholderia silviterrae]|uniref:DsbA family oxidoreductase n=1 Tax=Paraburkholderia silviterrae TaxID=2528715 RepID=A0A4R5M9V4_9BURK|nr:DsbA family oxidoreductase [Paraburkholderia silviterrae]TDG23406.1 DsbA family oxidoreductase [Paraburkholderia silviterrae]
MNTPLSPARELRVEFYFDFVCPWCLIGKRNLEAAIAELKAREPRVNVQIVWRPVELLPHTPLGGVPYEAFYLARLGSAQAVAQRRAQVRQAARSAGVELAFERIRVFPNTAAAHELVARATHVASERCGGQQAELIERLFTAYFCEGEDIGDAVTLARIARAHGIGDAAPAPRMDGASVRVEGVPYFVFGGRYAVSGAQPPHVLLDAMLRAADLVEAQPHGA